MNNRWSYKTHGIPDALFIRGEVPMTKSEVRSVTLSKLRLKSNDRIVDIGAGTGSISIECALMADKGMVYAVERKSQGVRLITENAKAFGTENIEVVQGVAPDILGGISNIDKVIIGGSGGRLKGIFDWMDLYLKKDGRVVINLITLENLYTSIQLLKDRDYMDIDVAQVAVSKGRNIAHLTMMEAQNPVFIISATKA